MSVPEIEQAISQLSAQDLARFSTWFAEFKADEWDKQIERDAATGKFDKMNAKADEDFEAGRCKPLWSTLRRPSFGNITMLFLTK